MKLSATGFIAASAAVAVFCLTATSLTERFNTFASSDAAVNAANEPRGLVYKSERMERQKLLRRLGDDVSSVSDNVAFAQVVTVARKATGFHAAPYENYEKIVAYCDGANQPVVIVSERKYSDDLFSVTSEKRMPDGQVSFFGSFLDGDVRGSSEGVSDGFSVHDVCSDLESFKNAHGLTSPSPLNPAVLRAFLEERTP